MDLLKNCAWMLNCILLLSTCALEMIMILLLPYLKCFQPTSKIKHPIH